MKECASQVSQKRIAKGDKTIDNLIELIERDTQEIKVSALLLFMSYGS